jgi:hypothetical protein
VPPLRSNLRLAQILLVINARANLVQDDDLKSIPQNAALVSDPVSTHFKEWRGAHLARYFERVFRPRSIRSSLPPADVASNFGLQYGGKSFPLSSVIDNTVGLNQGMTLASADCRSVRAFKRCHSRFEL